MSNTARKTGLKTDNFRSIFKQLMADSKDSLWLDMTSGSPAPQRKNGYEVISKKSDDTELDKGEEKFNVDT